MFGWLKNNKIRGAQAILSRHINRQAMQRVKGTHRPNDRTSYCRVAYLIPLIGNKPQHAATTPVVTHDISSTGISIIHNDRIDAQNVLIGLPEDEEFSYLKCRVEHCTRLSPEFVKIGLHAEEHAENITGPGKANDVQKGMQLVQTTTNTPQPTVAGILEHWGDAIDNNQ